VVGWFTGFGDGFIFRYGMGCMLDPGWEGERGGAKSLLRYVKMDDGKCVLVQSMLGGFLER
jgi:hypothetical protein